MMMTMNLNIVTAMMMVIMIYDPHIDMIKPAWIPLVCSTRSFGPYGANT
jgi:hypothetical protein